MKTVFEAHGSTGSAKRNVSTRSKVALSFVIPVFNGAENIAKVVERISALCFNLTHEIVLVDDGSSDRSCAVCFALAQRFPEAVCVVELARNFGEHNAVMAGLHETRGRYVVVLDDDGQNPPEEALHLWNYARSYQLDVVYARYAKYNQSILRRACSWFNDQTATLFLNKPANLYLSSFKVMSRFVVDEITRYRGPFPYIDALILRTTQNISACNVMHYERLSGRSGYTLSRLATLWLNATLGYSMLPVRLMMLFGVNLSALSIVALSGILLSAQNSNMSGTHILPCLLASVVLICGVQLTALGLVGEYVCRLYQQQSGCAQFVIRHRFRAVVQRTDEVGLSNRPVLREVAR